MLIMKLNPEPFELIKNGKKKWEIRLNDDKRRNVKIGDTLIFKKTPDCLEGVIVRVLDIKHFNNFREMATILSIKDLGFEEGTNVDMVEKAYYNYYTMEEEIKNGVVAFKIELI